MDHARARAGAYLPCWKAVRRVPLRAQRSPQAPDSEARPESEAKDSLGRRSVWATAMATDESDESDERAETWPEWLMRKAAELSGRTGPGPRAWIRAVPGPASDARLSALRDPRGQVGAPVSRGHLCRSIGSQHSCGFALAWH